MKKINLIEWLSRNSHEKQKPQCFARYAAILIMLLTIGVGQMWGAYIYLDVSQDLNSGHWYDNSAYFWLWDGSSDCKNPASLGNNVWRFTTSNETGSMTFKRMHYENNQDQQWNYMSISITSSSNIAKTTSWGSNGATNGSLKGYNIQFVNGGGEIYFDNTPTQWNTSYIYFVIGRDHNTLAGSDATYFKVYAMSRVNGTELWHVSVSDTWNDAEWYGVIGSNSEVSNGVYTSSKLAEQTKFTAAYTNVYNLNSGSNYLLTPESGDNGTAFDITYYDNLTALKKAFYPRYITVSATLDPSTITPSTNTDVTFNLTTNVPTSESPSFYFQMANWGAANSGAAGGYNMDGDHQMNSTSNPSHTKSNVNLSEGTYKTKIKITWDGTDIKESELITLNVVNTNKTLAYNDNGKTGGGAAPTGGSYAHNSVQTVAGNTNTMTKDNYTFAGWNTNATISGTAYAASSSITMNQDYTLYAKWTQTITLDANTSNHGDGDNSSATAVWNKAGLESFSATSGESGYRLLGYYTAPTGGTKILNADGSFADSNITDYITSGKWSRTDAAPTLYAHWAADEWKWYTSTTYQQTFINTGTDEYKLNIEVTNDNKGSWKFVLNDNLTTWYYTGADDAVSTDITLAYGTGYMAWTGNSGANGHYTLKIWKDNGVWKYRAYASPQITFTASPTGGNVKADSESDGSNITSGTYIMYNTEATFTATPSSGYTFDGFYTNSTCTEGKTTTNPLTVSSITSDTARYAKFTEDKVTLTANDGDHGTVAITAGTSEIGISTSATITATPATHYHVARWETSSNVVTVSGGGATSTITVRTDGTGDAATVTPIYAEDNSTFKLYKQTSAGTSGIDEMWGYLGAATYSITLSDLPADTTYKIYVYDSSSDNKHYRNSGGSITVNHKSDNIYKYDTDDTGHYFSFKTSVAGTYTITFAYTSDPGTLSATYPVEPSYSATLSLKDGTTPGCSVSPRTGAITLHQYEYTTITATAEPGFRFKQWNTSGCSFADGTSSTSATAKFTATANGATIEAEFTNDGFIYFDNTMSKWGGDIYVYFFNTSNWWYNDKNDGKGPGVVANQNVHYHKMDQIPGTQIYYYDYHVANPATNAICFTSGDHHSSSGLWKTSAAWRSDFNSCLPCYIASENASQWKNETGYHNAGYWKRWGNTESGFTLYYDDGVNPEQHIDFTNSDPYSSIYNAEITLSSANTVYGYNVARCNGGKKLRRKDYSGNIQDSDSDYPRELAESDYNGGLRTSAAGTYKFQLSLASDHIMMTVEYPLSVGDYRVRLVNDSKNHSSGRIIRARGDKSRTDTVSFFIDHTKAASNVLYVDSCTSTGNPPGWNRISDVVKATLSLNTDPYNATTGVYKFGLKHTNHKDVELVLLDEPEYDGSYYVRTDGLDGRWTAYMTTPDNKMQYSKKSLDTKANYDYYVPKWIENGTNVQFTIANDYSPCISDTLYGDTETGGADVEHQTLPADANVRFMWNSGNNRISRAYLDGATVVGSNFLKLHSETSGKIFNKNNVVITDTIFEDTKNWIYQVDIKAEPGATARLTAEYNGNTQDLIDGGEDAQQLIGGSGTTKYPLRMVYDFKTNILISAWIAETDQALGTTTMALDADLMIIRHLQEHAAQLTFTSGSISKIKTIYGALRFDYDDMVGKMDNWYASGIYSKLIYDVSFPFDVNVKDIFGVGQMGDHWVIQKYNGAKRAKEGLFLGDDDTYWEDLTADSVMHAYEGYTVFIDRPSFNSSESVIWQNKEAGGSVYLYFPSASVDDKTISRGDITLHFDSLNCKIDRSFNDPEHDGQVLYHKYTDSNWRMIGTPLLSDTTGNFSELFRAAIDYDDPHPFRYLYEWNDLDNSYRIASTTSFTFKSMHGYMVQYAGDITFKGTYIHKAPSRIVAAEQTNDDVNYLIDLQMKNMDEDMVHTYVELRNNACDTFVLNEDVYMVRSSTMADLYTYAGAYDVAANVLSVGNHIVPVGMNVKKAGTYTFSMPNSFNGTVTLLDTYTGARADLAMSDYTVNLPKGVNNERFQLEINISKVPTAIDGVEGGSLKDGKTHKFIMNDMLYILKDGVIFDARGNRVK